MLGVHFGNGFDFEEIETCTGIGGVGDIFDFGFDVVAEDGAVEGEASHYPEEIYGLSYSELLAIS